MAGSSIRPAGGPHQRPAGQHRDLVPNRLRQGHRAVLVQMPRACGGLVRVRLACFHFNRFSCKGTRAVYTTMLHPACLCLLPGQVFDRRKNCKVAAPCGRAIVASGLWQLARNGVAFNNWTCARCSRPGDTPGGAGARLLMAWGKAGGQPAVECQACCTQLLAEQQLESLRIVALPVCRTGREQGPHPDHRRCTARWPAFGGPGQARQAIGNPGQGWPAFGGPGH